MTGTPPADGRQFLRDLEAVARLALHPTGGASRADVVAACEAIRLALDAEEAYVVHPGDPFYLRLDCDADPTTYEIKQRGYFYIWRELCRRPELPAGLCTVINRYVQDPQPLLPGVQSTHLVAILPAYESNAELLVIRGPWPNGLTSEQVAFITAVRPILAGLVASVLDTQHQERRRTQLALLADVAGAFTASDDVDAVLTGLATALAKVSGFDWVNVVLTDADATRLTDLAGNVSRYDHTAPAAEMRDTDEARAVWLSRVRFVRKIGRPWLLPDTAAPWPGEERDERLHANAEAFRAYCTRAHLLSLADIALHVRGEFLGMLCFSSATPHALGPDEVEFLEALATQAASSIAGLRLHSDLRKATDRLTYMATHDVLTDLPNRAVFTERLRETVAAAAATRRSGAVIYLDLDNFKLINDSRGHAAGDRLLQAIARRLRDCLPAGAIPARLGGDEFAVLLPRATPASAERVAARVLKALAAPITVDGSPLTVSASLGVSSFPVDGADAETVVRTADMAMYAAKAGGRNMVERYRPALAVPLVARLELEKRLRQALHDGELTVHYQPQVELASGRIAGMEALARWPQADGTEIPPTEFIPVAEQAGLIRPLGEFVLRRACAQAKRWHEAGLAPARLAVNVSPHQFGRGSERPGEDIASVVATILTEEDLPGELLELEITESAMLRDAAAVLDAVQRLAAHGVHLVIDDFGTGYSALAYLRVFPVSVLKIDRSFIAALHDNPRDRAIVEAIITMARGLGVAVIAEGVETDAQRDLLLELGCDLAQGYLYSRPVDAATATALLESQRDGGAVFAPRPLQLHPRRVA